MKIVKRSLRSPSILGNKYHRLTVIGRTDNITGVKKWICECDCGNLVHAHKYELEHPEKGRKSCG